MWQTFTFLFWSNEALEMVFVILFWHPSSIHIYIFEVCCQKTLCLLFFISLLKENCQNLCLCLLRVCVCVFVCDCCLSQYLLWTMYIYRIGFNGCRYSGIMNHFMWGLFSMRCYLFHLGSFIRIPLPPFLQGSISYYMYLCCTHHQYSSLLRCRV